MLGSNKKCNEIKITTVDIEEHTFGHTTNNPKKERITPDTLCVIDERRKQKENNPTNDIVIETDTKLGKWKEYMPNYLK